MPHPVQFHTVLWHCWLGGRWGFQPVKRNGTIYPSQFSSGQVEEKTTGNLRTQVHFEMSVKMEVFLFFFSGMHH